MPLYRCFVHGKNFPGILVGSKKPCGFYTTRFVEADNPKQAELQVLELLRNDDSLQIAVEHRTQDAQVFFEEIDEVSEINGPNKGFTFYTE